MTPHIGDLIAATLTATCWLVYWRVERIRLLPTWLLAFDAATFTVLAVWSLIAGDMPLTRIANGAFAAWLAYTAWKRRKPRQRKPSKVTGRVRDLGHRLVVSPG